MFQLQVSGGILLAWFTGAFQLSGVILHVISYTCALFWSVRWSEFPL